MKHACLHWLLGLCLAIGLTALPRSSFAQGFNISVTPMNPASITNPSGGTATAQIVVTSFGGFASRIHFSCAIVGGRAPLPACPDPPAVQLPAGGSAVSTLTVTTDNATPTATYTFKVRAGDTRDHGPHTGVYSTSLSVAHVYGIGNGGGGGIGLLTFLGLLALWAAYRSRRMRMA